MKKSSIKTIVSTLVILTLLVWYGNTPRIIYAESTDTNSVTIAPTDTPASAPEVTVEQDSYTISLGKVLNVNEIKLSITATGDYTVTFENGKTEMTFSKLGSFTEKVVVTDTELGLSTVVTINVKVVDKTKPVISGVKNIIATKDKKVSLLKGVSVKDNADGNLTSKIKVSSVNFAKVGTQKITYTVTDKAGNKAIKTATLTVKRKEVACNKIMYVNTSSLNVYKNSTADSGKVTSVTYRSKILVIATIKGSDWVKISLNDGKTVGYVNSKYLSTTQPAKQTTLNNNGGSSSGGSSNSGGSSSSGGSSNSGGSNSGGNSSNNSGGGLPGAEEEDDGTVISDDGGEISHTP